MAEQLLALQRAAAVVADLDPATAWDLDAELAGLAGVFTTLAAGLATWGERLTALGLHQSVTAPAETGSTHLAELAATFVGARGALRTVYAAQFAAAEAAVSPVDRAHFWGESSGGATAAVAGDPTPGHQAALPPVGQADPPPADSEGVSVVPGAMYLGDDTSVYLDWSCELDTGGRSIEAGDGDDAVVIALDADQLRELVRRLDSSDPDDAALQDLDAAGAYLDWSVLHPDGAREIEVSDGTDAVVLHLTAADLRALQTQLAADTAADDTAPLDTDTAEPGEQVDVGPGGLFLGDVNAGAVSWVGRGPAGGRNVQVDNSADVAEVGLTREQMRELRDRLAATLAGDQDADDRMATEAGAVSWQAVGDGRYRLRVDAGEDHSEVTLTEQQLRAVRTQLTADLAAEAAAAATFPGVTGRLADKHAGVTYDNEAQLTLPDGALPDDQAATCSRAVRLYRNGTWRQIGTYLRGGEDEVMQVREHPDQREATAEAVSAHVAQIDLAMQASPLGQPIELWRGVRDLPLVLGAELDDDLTGVQWTERSFPSTSVDPGVAGIFSDYDVLLRLHVPAGTGAIQLDSRPTEREHTREVEVLLQRGLQMRVTADQTQPVGEGRTVWIGGAQQHVPPPEYRVLDVEVTVPKPAVPEPSRSTEPIRPPNGGHGIDQGLMHFDSALGKLWNRLGDDQHLQVDGHALGNVITDLGEGITLHRHDTNHALRELRRIRTQLPDGSHAAGRVDAAIGRLDAPPRPAPALPDNAPQQLKDLMADLNAINLVRRGYDDGSGEPFHETDQLAEITHRWIRGELSRSTFERELEGLIQRRHESSEGWTEIREAIGRALRDFRQWAKRPDCPPPL